MSDSNIALNVTYDDKDSLFQYSNTSNRIRGDWIVNDNPDYHGGTTRISSVKGATISWRFRGVAFTILGDKLDGHGSFQIRIDDEDAGTYSGFANRSLDNDELILNQTLFASEMLDYGLHRVEYLNVGAQTEEETGDAAVFDSLQVQIRGPEDPTSTTIGSASDYIPSASAEPANSDDDQSVSGGAIAGAVVGAVAGIALLALLAWHFLRRRRRSKDLTSAQSGRSEIEAGPAPMSSLPAPGGFAHFMSSSQAQGNSVAPPSTMDPASTRPSAATGSAATPTTFTINNPDHSPQTRVSGQHEPGFGQVQGTSAPSTAPQAGSNSAPQDTYEPPPMYSQQTAAATKGSFAEHTDPRHTTQ